MRTTVRGLRRSIREALIPKNVPVYVNAGTDVADEIEPQVVDIVKKSYEPVGGHHKIAKTGDVSAAYSDWVVADVDDDSDVDVFVGANKKHGHKIGVTATDGTSAAKQFMMALKHKLLTNGWWVEVSGAPAHVVMNKLKISPISDEKKVRALVGDDIEWHGEHPEGLFPGTNGWYSRNIGGKKHTKIVVGDV